MAVLPAATVSRPNLCGLLPWLIKIQHKTQQKKNHKPKQKQALTIVVCVAAWLGDLLPHSGDVFGSAPHPGCVPSTVVQVKCRSIFASFNSAYTVTLLKCAHSGCVPRASLQGKTTVLFL